MIRQRPNLARIEQVAEALGPLRERLVFVGGCAVDLLLTDLAAAPSRVTYDVDLVARVEALADYHALEADFARRGFKRDITPDAPICRWRCGELEVDLMPTDPGVLGFSNRWYPLAVRTALAFQLDSGHCIRLISAPAFVATKFEAFRDRGREDLLTSHDLEDIINLFDGRPELPDEIATSDPELATYLASCCGVLIARPDFRNALPGLVFPDDTVDVRAAWLYARLARVARFVQP